jgi:hypothetical protein
MARTLIIIAACICAVLVFLKFRKARQVSVHLTRRDVESALANVLDLDGSGTHDAFDLFLASPIDEPYLESIRQECIAVLKQNRHQKPAPGRDLCEADEQWVREKLRGLQTRPERDHDT